MAADDVKVRACQRHAGLGIGVEGSQSWRVLSTGPAFHSIAVDTETVADLDVVHGSNEGEECNCDCQAVAAGPPFPRLLRLHATILSTQRAPSVVSASTHSVGVAIMTTYSKTARRGQNKDHRRGGCPTDRAQTKLRRSNCALNVPSVSLLSPRKQTAEQVLSSLTHHTCSMAVPRDMLDQGVAPKRRAAPR